MSTYGLIGARQRTFHKGVHHLVPVRDGGEPFDPDNCAVVCRHHHEVIERRARAAKQARLRRE